MQANSLDLQISIPVSYHGTATIAPGTDYGFLYYGVLGKGRVSSMNLYFLFKKSVQILSNEQFIIESV